MTVLDNFEQWKEFLSERVQEAKSSGMSENTIEDMAYHIGNYLAEEVDPKNREQRLLQELWKVGDKDERKTLAELMVKLVKH